MFTIQKLQTLFGHQDSVYALATTEKPNIFFSAAADGYVVCWDLENVGQNQEVIGKVIAKISNSIYTLHRIADKNYLVVGHNTDGIHLIDLANYQEIFSVGFTKSAIFDSKHWKNDLWVACGDGNVLVIDLLLFSLKKTLSFSDKSARCIAICEQRQEIAVGYSDNHIRIFDANTYLQKADFQAHSSSIFTLSYSPDANFLLSGSRDAHLKIWNTSQNYYLQQDIVAHLFTINHIAYSPDGIFFLTCSKDKSIKLWRSADFALLKVIDKGRYAGHGTSINKLIWLDNLSFASCSDDTTIAVWKIIYPNQA
jgi:WD40 repeat protein